MGQYYRAVLIDGMDIVKVISSHDIDSNFSKLTEHSWIGNTFVNAALAMVKDRPHRIAWMGDYAKNFDGEGDAYEKKLSQEVFEQYFDAAWSDEADKHRVQEKALPRGYKELLTHATSGLYLLNHTRKEYIDFGRYISDNTVRTGDWDGWCVNPLPLLTACGNGRGGGDYYDQTARSNVGTWAFDLIECRDSVPPDYMEGLYAFPPN